MEDKLFAPADVTVRAAKSALKSNSWNCDIRTFRKSSDCDLRNSYLSSAPTRKFTADKLRFFKIVLAQLLRPPQRP